MKSFNQNWKDFHEGKLSKSQAREFITYLDSPDGNRDFQQLLKIVWGTEANAGQKGMGLPGKPEPPEPGKRLDRSAESQRKQSRTPRRIATWLRYAASLVFFLLMLREIGFMNEAADTQNSSDKKEQAAWVVKSNPKGRKSKILLPDSSLVFLNAGSELSYPRNFTENRQVLLRGEAFFDVKKYKQQPFLVKTAHVTTTVLGTSFNINTDYLESTEIALATGKISIRNDYTGKDMLLRPGEASLVSRGEQPMKKFTVDPAKIPLWTEGVLHFEKEPFVLVKNKLENWYGVEIAVNGPVPDVKCSGTFEKQAYLSDVLAVLAHSVRFSFDIDGKNVVIYPISS
ncbi:ferric-dicitrate binding protein FerR, regulates iron transport through sigma-19 [Cyclobacterium xiamenense]|uniref:Ferric-dicitrate binding protein FerR, regulates iron transport through sigma-19 n=1 Tax=Cyclobacterium xiamenense TaxID=1297121 RepID=A0A1H6UIA0_9BACT|nr:FecR family protein [Cyclobacterium xiamenense]SEI92051.1 ferric-dicitrate binding protein FerR, regulates iron transport through sigma-19 [Cyclobacterium xiamenense]